MANLVGTAGEHFTAAELSRLGFLVTLTRGNAPGIDILAYHPTTQRTVALQVKTAHSSKQPRGKWMMNAKDADETQLRSQAFVLVRFGDPPSPPEFSIVPSVNVARALHSDHKAWEEAPGARGQPHSLKNTIRQFKDTAGDWRNRWDIILNLAGLSGTAGDAGAAERARSGQPGGEWVPSAQGEAAAGGQSLV